MKCFIKISVKHKLFQKHSGEKRILFLVAPRGRLDAALAAGEALGVPVGAEGGQRLALNLQPAARTQQPLAAILTHGAALLDLEHPRLRGMQKAANKHEKPVNCT